MARPETLEGERDDVSEVRAGTREKAEAVVSAGFVPSRGGWLGEGVRRMGTALGEARFVASVEAAMGLSRAAFWEWMWRWGLLKWLAAFPKV
jgi:hypothetical protein